MTQRPVKGDMGDLDADLADEMQGDRRRFEPPMGPLMPRREERDGLPRLVLGAKGVSSLASAYAQATEARMGLVVEQHRRT
jgi:hypothetical protein